MSPTLYLTIMLVGCFIILVTSVLVNHVKLKETMKQDITFEEMLIAEEKVSDFLKKNSIEPGADILLICKALNIECHGIDTSISSQAHLNSPDKDGVMVAWLKEGLTPRQQKFALAHECGHIINGDAVPIDRPEGVGKDVSEQKADYIAAALLMPADDVYKFLVERNFQSASPQVRVKIAQTLCKKYDVDDIFVTRRIREVVALKKFEGK